MVTNASSTSIRKRNRALRWAAAVVVAAGALVVPVAPASAAFLSPVTLVSAQSVADSVAQKSARVVCPSGTKLVGAGASIGYITDEVLITGIVPSSSSATAYASEDDTGYLGTWYVKVTAACAPTPSGYEIVSSYHPVSSDPSVYASASCPAGKVMLGGNADVSINNSGWAVPRNIPDVNANQLLASSTSETMIAFAYEDSDGTTQQWILTVYAICADPVVSLQRVYSWGAMENTDTRYELLTCPAGTSVLSAGGHIFDSTGEVSFTTLTPGRYGTSSFVILEAAEDEDGLSGLGFWRMDAWATCAPTVTAVHL
jgi:hypothetical protein